MVENYSKKHSSMITASLFMIILLMGNIPYLVAQQQQTLTICFYVDSPSNPFSPGHGFVQLIDSANPNSGSQVYGKYPGGWDIFGGSGEIKDDSKRNWDWKICYTVTRAQYNAVVNFITNEIKNPSNYNLLGTNCVSWQQTIAGLAGITLPTTKNRVSIDDPYAFEQALEAIGNNGSFGTGKVVSNTNKVTPVNSPVPTMAQQAQNPQQCSYDGIKQYAMEDSTAIAEALHLEYIVKENEPIDTSPQVTFVTETDPSTSMIIWDFGDGQFEDQLSTVQHNYATGIFTPNVLVINGDSVVNSSFDINVSPDFPPSEIFVDVPDATQTFPYTPSPPPLPPGTIGVQPSPSDGADSFFDVFIDVRLDPGGHAQFIGMPSQLQLQTQRSDSNVIFDGPFPFLDVSGSIQPNGSFKTSGTGTVAGFPNILVNFDGSITNGSLSGDYIMGVNGGLPGGHPITYGVEGQLVGDGVEVPPEPSPTPSPPPTDTTLPSELTIKPNVKSRSLLPGNTVEFTLDILAPAGFTDDFILTPRVMTPKINPVGLFDVSLHPPINVYDETLQGYRDVTLAVTVSADAMPGPADIVLGASYTDSTGIQISLDNVGSVSIDIRSSEETPSVGIIDPTGEMWDWIALDQPTVGVPTSVSSTLQNNLAQDQEFTYIVQVKDNDGNVIFLSWENGTIPPNSIANPALTYVPDFEGDFTVEIFVWDNLDNPFALTPVMMNNFTTDLRDADGMGRLSIDATGPHVADGTDASTIRVRAIGPDGEPAVGADVDVVVTAGFDFSQVLPTEYTGNGYYTTTLTTTFATDYNLVGVAPDFLDASTFVQFVPGPPTDLVTDVMGPFVGVDNTMYTIQTIPLDKFGNAVYDSFTNVRTDFGAVNKSPLGTFPRTFDVFSDAWGRANVHTSILGTQISDDLVLDFPAVVLDSDKGVKENVPFDVSIDLATTGIDLGKIDLELTFDPSLIQIIEIADPDPSDGIEPTINEAASEPDEGVVILEFTDLDSIDIPIKHGINAADLIIELDPEIDIGGIGGTGISYLDFTIEAEVAMEDRAGNEVAVPDDLAARAAEIRAKSIRFAGLPVKIWIINGTATEQQIRDDINEANDALIDAAFNCNCTEFVTIIPEFNHLSSDKWGEIDDDGDNKLDDDETDELPKKDKVKANIYYAPALDGDTESNNDDVLGTTLDGPGAIGGGVAVDNGKDHDNFTLAHELLHLLSNGRIKDSPSNTGRDQGARNPDNLMNYDDTGSGITKEQCDLIISALAGR